MFKIFTTLLYPIIYLRTNYLLKNNLITTLCFHNVSKSENRFYPHIKPQYFEELCQFLSERFKVIKPQDIDASKQTEKPLLILSFDDAYLNYYQIVIPILEKYDLPSILNVISACPDNKKTYDWQAFVNFFERVGYDKCIDFGKRYKFYNRAFKPEKFILAFTNYFQSLDKISINKLVSNYLKEIDYKRTKMMSWNQIREVYNKGHEIGSHTHNHFYINRLSSGEIEYELSHSKHRIESELKNSIGTFTFPGSKHSDDNFKKLKKIGFKNYLLVGNDTSAIGDSSINRFLMYGNSTSRLLLQALGVEAFFRNNND